MFKVGDRVRNTGRGYSDLAKEGIVVSVGNKGFEVKFDGYETLYCYDKDVELIKEEKEMEIPKAYKAMILKDGKLMSIWAGHRNNDGTTLFYKEGEITYAPEGSLGLFVEEAMERAQKNGITNKRGEGILVVHEVTPLGGQMPVEDDPFSRHTRYPAVLVGKAVWTELALKEEWVDVTRECKLSIEPNSSGGFFIYISHGSFSASIYAMKKSPPSWTYPGWFTTCPNDYKVETCGDMGFKVFNKVTR